MKVKVAGYSYRDDDDDYYCDDCDCDAGLSHHARVIV